MRWRWIEVGADKHAALSAAVDFASVPHVDDQHKESLVVNFIKDAKVADPDSPGIAARKLSTALRSRVLCEISNRSRYSVTVAASNSGKLPLCAALDLKLIRHVG